MLRLGAALIVVVLLTAQGAIPAYSQQPPPGRGYTHAEHQGAAAQKGESTTSDQRGTKETPLVIQIDQSGGHEAITTKTKEEGRWYANPDWWIASLTGFLVLVTAGLWIFTGLMWSATRDLAKLGREEFLASNRPELDIQFIRRTQENPTIPPDGQSLGAEFSIVNKGRSEATVTGSRFSLAWMETTDIPTPNALAGEDVIPHHRFLVGATDRAWVYSNNLGGLAEAEAVPNRKLYLIGWIVYEDAMGPNKGTPRTGYFLRVFNPATRLFDDPRPSGVGIDWEWNTTL